MAWASAVKSGVVGPNHGGKRGQRIAQQIARNTSKRK
jgi:hypothetical protein